MNLNIDGLEVVMITRVVGDRFGANRHRILLYDQKADGQGNLPFVKAGAGPAFGARSGRLAGRLLRLPPAGPGLDPEREVTDIYARCMSGRRARALIAGPTETDPPVFDPARYVSLEYPVDAVIYEMHVRDFTLAATSSANGLAAQGDLKLGELEQVGVVVTVDVEAVAAGQEGPLTVAVPDNHRRVRLRRTE